MIGPGAMQAVAIVSLRVAVQAGGPAAGLALRRNRKQAAAWERPNQVGDTIVTIQGLG